MTEQRPETPLDFERIYLQEHARCLELEAQLNSLRDAARAIVLNRSEVTSPTSPFRAVIEAALDDLQDELNKE